MPGARRGGRSPRGTPVDRARTGGAPRRGRRRTSTVGLGKLRAPRVPTRPHAACPNVPILVHRLPTNMPTVHNV
jgi:hypothetical protein